MNIILESQSTQKKNYKIGRYQKQNRMPNADRKDLTIEGDIIRNGNTKQNEGLGIYM